MRTNTILHHGKISALGLLAVMCAMSRVVAGPGHDHSHDFPGVGGEGHSGPVVLTESQRKNLGLQVVEAEIREMGRVVEVPAVLVLPPERHAVVSATFPGRVGELLVKLGEEVRAGDAVLRVFPLQVGSPAQTLVSPIAGRVIRVNTNPGAVFTSETALVEIGDDAELLARGLFFQTRELSRIKLGEPAEFLVDVYPGESFEGVLQRVDTGHGADDPTFHIYALIPNAHRRLLANYRGRLVIVVEPKQPVVAVPRRAVLGSMGKSFVFIEDEEGHFERREVVTGVRSGEFVEIVEGVLPGERVVTVGNYQLQFFE